MRDNVPVLLVDDDEVDAMTVTRAFEKNRIANPLHVVTNGQLALHFLRRQGAYRDPAESPRPGIILLDLNMPVMNGIEFLRAVKADSDLKRIPVVVLTSSGAENDKVESFGLFVAGYIIKPVEFGKFVEAIKAINIYWTLSERS